MITLRQNLRVAFRNLRAAPGLSITAVVTLALGIAITTTMFSVVNRVLLRPLPYPNPDRLISIGITSTNNSTSLVPDSDFLAWRREARTFTTLAAYAPRTANLSGGAGPERTDGAAVTENFFPTLGVRPLLGRNFTPDEDRRGGPAVAILSHDFWQRRFNGDPSVIGAVVMLDAEPHRVVGVMPASLDLPWRASYWMPMALEASFGNIYYLNVVGRLEKGATVARATAELTTISSRVHADDPEVLRGGKVGLLTLHDHFYGSARLPILVLFGVVMLVLLIAAANVTGLQLAWGATRHRELGIRAALGAGRGRLLAQVLTEGAVLAAVAGALGLFGATIGVRLMAATGSSLLSHIPPISVDLPILAFTLAITIAAGIGATMLPALTASNVAPHHALKGGLTLVGGKTSRVGLRRLLVSAQLALTIVLLVGTGLLLKSLGRMVAVDPGFRPDHLISIGLSLPASKYPYEASVRTPFFQRLVERVRNLPGVDAAILAEGPFQGYSLIGPVTVAGTPHVMGVVITLAEPSYFNLLGITIVSGRAFNRDDGVTTEPVAILNETGARALFPGEDPIGKQLTLPAQSGARVIGIARDVRQLDRLGEPATQAYYPLSQPLHPPYGSVPANLLIKATGTAGAVIEEVRQAVLEIDPDLPLEHATTLEVELADRVGTERFISSAAALFTGLALSLALVGLYGLIAHLVSQRTREMGIRSALGAKDHDIIAMVIRENISILAVGIVAGLVVAVASTRVLTRLLFHLSPLDPPVFAIGALLMSAVALLACYLPARRAARVNPVIALRSE